MTLGGVRVRGNRAGLLQVLRVSAVVVAGLAAVVALVWSLPGVVVEHDLGGTAVEPKDQVVAVNNVRTTLLQAVAGLGIFVAAYVAWRQVRIGQEGVSVAREGQIVDRFSRAVDQVGSDSLDVRLGGLHALWRVADHSVRDRSSIIAIMAAFVRIHLPWAGPAADEPINAVLPLETRAPDTQVALTCLGVLSEGRPPEWLNLISTDLRRADLDGLNLQGIIFDRSSLEAATLFRVDLTQASLIGAVLRHAELSTSVLRQARLRGGDLRGAHLADADLCGADFTGADLREANLRRVRTDDTSFRGADMRMADLRGADLGLADLSGVRLQGACSSAGTRWPTGFGPDAAGAVLAEDDAEPGISQVLSGATLRADLPTLRSYP